MPVPEWFAELLRVELKTWVELSDAQILDLYQHYHLLERWNQKINLTSVEPGKEMVIRHYCESLFFGAQLPPGVTSIADIGSGAGFPGVPIAILRRKSVVSLIESNQRKAVFLREATRGLSNVSVFGGRAEDLRTIFDCLVSRAVDQSEFVAMVPRLALRIGLMVAEDDYLALTSVKHIAWADPIRLPWGDHRICVFGQSST